MLTRRPYASGVAGFFADCDPDDVLVLHFSCHGLKDQRGRLYLAASDTRLRSLAATALAASFVADQMSESVSSRILLILDCCYSGAFARGAAVGGDRAIHLEEEFGGSGGRTVLTAVTASSGSVTNFSHSHTGMGAIIFGTVPFTKID